MTLLLCSLNNYKLKFTILSSPAWSSQMGYNFFLLKLKKTQGVNCLFTQTLCLFSISVALQFPEGLLLFACTIADILERYLKLIASKLVY